MRPAQAVVPRVHRRARRRVLCGAAAACLLAALDLAPRAQPAARPKYGPAVVRLYQDRAYLRAHEAPDFWALIPYYLPEETDSACSVATVAMLINALRADRSLRADEKLAGHAELLRRAASLPWQSAVKPGGDGVGLDQLGPLIEQSLAAYGIRGYRVDVVHLGELSAQTLAQVREALSENEASDRDFIVANFLQSGLTGDPEGRVGHFAPIAAYDAERRRVLILDPDRDWYEPYWVPDELLVEAMTTRDASAGRSRGFLWVRPERGATAPPRP
jgi:hypothetical protein